MAKYLNQTGITVLVGQITNAYDERYAAISHTHTTANVISLGGYSATSVSGTTLTDNDSLNAALKKLYNLSSSKLSTIPIATRTVLGGIKVGKHYTGAATFSPVATDPATAPAINSVSTTAGRYYAVETDSNGLAFVNVPWADYNTTYTIATTTTAGLVKPFSVITKPTINTPSTTTGKYYHVEMSSDGNMFVNVPWTDTKNPGTVTSVAMTVPTGLAVSGSPITSAGTLALTFAPGYSIPETADQTNWNTAYGWGNHASAGYLKSVPQASASVLGGIKIGYATTGKNYAVQLDDEGKAFVSVPWTDTKNPGTVTSITLTQGTGITVSSSGTAITSTGTRTISLKQATSGELGGIKIGYTENGKNYPVELDSAGKAFVNVPWTDTNTTYTAAKFNVLGLLKPSKTYTGAATLTTPAASATTAPTIAAISATNGRYYAVESDVNGVPFVNVPWTDTNTTYTFTPSNPTLAWGTQSSIGVIGNKTYNVTMPAKPTADDIGALPVSGTAVAASKVTNSLILKVKSGSTEGTDQYTFNGSAAKTLNIKAGSNVSLTAAAGVLTIAATNTTYSAANQTTLGLIKPWMVHTAASTYNGGSTAPTSNATAVNVNALSTTSSRYYAVEMDNAGRAFVNVPWTDTKNAGTVTSITLTEGSGIMISNSGTPITSEGESTISLKTASNTTLGGVLPLNSRYITFDTSAWISPADAEVDPLARGAIYINQPSSDFGRFYAVETNQDGIPFVNIPWEDTTYSAATTSTAGLMSAADKSKLNGIATGATANKGTVTSITLTQGTGITVSDSGVPITISGSRTIYLDIATNSSKGGFKPWMSRTVASTYDGGSIGPAANNTKVNVNALSTATGRYYAVEIDNAGRAFVNVPWTDTNTTYTFTPANPTLAWGATSSIGTIGGRTFKVSMPAKPTASEIGASATGHKHVIADITDFSALTESEIQAAVSAALASL